MFSRMLGVGIFSFLWWNSSASCWWVHSRLPHTCLPVGISATVRLLGLYRLDSGIGLVCVFYSSFLLLQLLPLSLDFTFLTDVCWVSACSAVQTERPPDMLSISILYTLHFDTEALTVSKWWWSDELLLCVCEEALLFPNVNGSDYCYCVCIIIIIIIIVYYYYYYYYVCVYIIILLLLCGNVKILFKY